MSKFVVRLTEQGSIYGPFTNRPDAQDFADFLSAEVDPAEVLNLASPEGQLIAWWQAKTGRNGGQPW